jgi:putative GTP pyrophosphokinase
MAAFSRTQIDRLGDRLRRGPFSQDDLRMLDQYRRTFGAAYETVITTIRDRLQLEPTGRPAKSTSSIIDKLRRESIRLSQVQDIAGCRVIVADILAQDQTVAILRETFQDIRIMDRRANPSYGYRAVHVIVQTEGLGVEVQVRSALQHLWAELSERLADVVDSTIKYGGGNTAIREYLSRASAHIGDLEEVERDLDSWLNAADGEDSQVESARESIARMKKNLAEWFPNFVSQFEVQKK